MKYFTTNNSAYTEIIIPKKIILIIFKSVRNKIRWCLVNFGINALLVFIKLRLSSKINS